MYEDIHRLGDQQLSIRYKHNEKALFEVKKEISDHLYETLKIEIDRERMDDTERFHEGIQNVERHIMPEMMKEFMELFGTKKALDKEICTRQKNMLKDIGIQTPSIRVLEILKETGGEYFHSFSDMIRYIKCDNAGRTDKWPKGKKIYVPAKIRDMEKKLRTTILTILAKNLGPCSN